MAIFFSLFVNIYGFFFLQNNLKKTLDKSRKGRYILSMNDRNWGGQRKGAGRKATGLKTVNVNLTLTIAEAEALRMRAESLGLTPSRFVAKWLGLTPR